MRRGTSPLSVVVSFLLAFLVGFGGGLLSVGGLPEYHSFSERVWRATVGVETASGAVVRTSRGPIILTSGHVVENFLRRMDIPVNPLEWVEIVDRPEALVESVRLDDVYSPIYRGTSASPKMKVTYRSEGYYLKESLATIALWSPGDKEVGSDIAILVPESLPSEVLPAVIAPRALRIKPGDEVQYAGHPSSRGVTLRKLLERSIIMDPYLVDPLGLRDNPRTWVAFGGQAYFGHSGAGVFVQRGWNSIELVSLVTGPAISNMSGCDIRAIVYGPSHRSISDLVSFWECLP